MKKNPTTTLLRGLAGALASAAILLGILSLPWRGERPLAPPSVSRAASGRGPLAAGVAVRTVELGPAPTIGGFPRLRWSAVGVLEPVTARALVLSEPGCRVALASAEILLVPEALSLAVKARVADLGLDAVVVAATHTHAGPGGYWSSLVGQLGATGPYDQATFDRLADALAGAIRDARAAAAPATLALARGREVGLARNRTGAAVDGRLLSLRLSRLDGAPLAELVAYPSHPTLLDGDNRLVSGDWVASLLSAAPRGPRLFVQGALGDQSTEQPAAPPGPPRPVTARLAAYGEALSAALERLPAGPADPAPALALASATVTMPPVTVGAVPAWLRPAVWTVAGGLLPATAQVTALRLGGALLLFTPAEPVEEVGRAWRAAAGPDAEVLSLADGYVGYVDTAARVRAGGGEAHRVYYGPEEADRLEVALVAAARAADQAAGVVSGRR